MASKTMLARRYRWEVNLGSVAVPDWRPVPGVTEFKPPVTPITQADFDYDSDGWKGYTKTAQEWAIEAKVSHKEDDNGNEIDPVHAFMRAASRNLGGDEVVHMRWYDRRGNSDAQEAHGIITWAEEGGDAEQLDAVSVTVAPSAVDPALTPIDNPVATTPGPVVSALSTNQGPAAGRTLVIITGAYLTGATSVKFGAEAAEDFEVVSGTKIAATSPDGAAGIVDVTVTTPNGTSANTAADNFTYV